MMRFKTFISEGKYPVWVRLTVSGLVLKVRNLSKSIENEQDPVKQNKMIAQQNKLISYINGLGIAIGTSDKTLLRRIKSVNK
ncbi:hypothetical protein J8Z28_17565 [Pseudoalteromonas sp. SCSIO 43088]|uniref:hypothetical protein n=1 Tax=Pseudoalteromonas sp. SCSIO 43088 TaxID=2822846 RepID=UPI00202B0A41|nr:hypothetical protein [Pseudoalteromonas sp. SCSIO 43088]URQ86301.1 hypothetical protein J8Z28_17565 [Pseudoalteromonas sp. SCSIO 43088]